MSAIKVISEIIAGSGGDYSKLIDIFKQFGLETAGMGNRARLVKIMTNWNEDYVKQILLEFLKWKGCQHAGDLHEIKGLVEKYGELFDVSTVLIDVVYGGHLHILKYIVDDLGFDVRWKNNWLMNVACNCGHLEIVEYLYERGADLMEELREDLVSVVCSMGYFDILEFLVDKGLHCDEDSLILACSRGFEDIARFLVENGVSIHPQCLEDAIEGEFMELADFLLKSGGESLVSRWLDGNSVVSFLRKKGVMLLV